MTAQDLVNFLTETTLGQTLNVVLWPLGIILHLIAVLAIIYGIVLLTRIIKWMLR